MERRKRCKSKLYKGKFVTNKSTPKRIQTLEKILGRFPIRFPAVSAGNFCVPNFKKTFANALAKMVTMSIIVVCILKLIIVRACRELPYILNSPLTIY